MVKAIARGLVDARIDGTASTVAAGLGGVGRAYGPTNWASLGERLAAWKGQVAGLLATLEART